MKTGASNQARDEGENKQRGSMCKLLAFFHGASLHVANLQEGVSG